MNIFVLSTDPVEAAQMQCNVHTYKMCVESAQMLSTAHRMLDGRAEKRPSKSGKRMTTQYIHPDPDLDERLYKAAYCHHPCTVWTMTSSANYQWHYQHFIALGSEFEFRYGTQHLSYTKLKDVLANTPKNILVGPRTDWPLAMGTNPECMFEGEAVRSYRAYYQTKQERFVMEWKNRPVPEWFSLKGK